MVSSIIDTVNEKNGGPITEGKVEKIINDERLTNIKADIEAGDFKIR